MSFGFLSPFGASAFACWASWSRSGVRPSSRLAYHSGRSGPGRGFHVPHVQDAIGLGALFTPGTAVFSQPSATWGPPPAAFLRLVPVHSGPTFPFRKVAITGPMRIHLRSPVRSSPCLWPPMGAERPLGFPPGFAPGRYQPRTPEVETDLEH